MKRIRCTRYVTPLKEGGSLPAVVQAEARAKALWPKIDLVEVREQLLAFAEVAEGK